MIHIAIIEDDLKDQEKLKNFFSKLIQEENLSLNISYFGSGEDFLASFHYGLYDLVLMDVELPQKNGIQTSAKMREIDSDVFLVFMTNLAQYAIDGYKVKAMDYIVKPVAYYDFKTRIANALEQLQHRKKTKVLIGENDKKIVVSLQDIFYIEIKDHLLVYHTKNGDYRTYGALKPLAKELEPYGFSLCNSCFLINLAYVESVEGFNVAVNKTDLLISHPKRKSFLNDLNRYLGKI